MLQGLAWADEISSSDAGRAWRTLSALGAADWLDEKYKIPRDSAQKLYCELASMPEYALSEADRIRMREEVAGSGNCLYAVVAARRYILTATMVYQHQVGSKLRPDTSVPASVFSWGGGPQGHVRYSSADEIAPPVITREDIAGLRARGYSLLDEGAWNRIIALLRNMHMNKERISDAERLRREIFAATPEELMSGGLDGLLYSRERTP